MNRQFETGAQRDTGEGKPRMSLIPIEELDRVARHYTTGAAKYGANNWKKGMPLSVYYDSAQRHMMKWYFGDKSEDHLAAAVWNILGAMWTEQNKPEMDDREE
mgnify:CR=1 FL=1